MAEDYNQLVLLGILVPLAAFDPTKVNNVYALVAVLAVLLVGLVRLITKDKSKTAAIWTVLVLLVLCIGALIYSVVRGSSGGESNNSQDQNGAGGPKPDANNDPQPPTGNRDIIADLGTIQDAGAGDKFPEENYGGRGAYTIDYPNLHSSAIQSSGQVPVLVTNNIARDLQAVHIHFQVYRNPGDSPQNPPPHFSIYHKVPKGKTIKFICNVGHAYQITNNDEHGYYGP